MKMGKYNCLYRENGILVEDNNVDKDVLEGWFLDSYEYHTGSVPMFEDIDNFTKGIIVHKDMGNLHCEWELFEM